MTKTIKLSLAAALLSTAAYAAPKVSGSLAHQFQKKDTDAAGEVLNTKVSLKTTGAVNDNISYAVSYSERVGGQSDDLGNGTNGLKLSNAKFVVKTDVATVIAGRQGLTTPWTNGSSAIDSTNVGNGVVALAPAGSATLVGAYVLGHNINNALVGKSSYIAIAGLLGKADMVNYEAWYSKIGEDTSTGALGLTGLTVAASAKIENVNVKARYSSVSPELSTMDTQTLVSVEAKAKFDSVTVNAGFAQAGKDGGLVSLDGAGNAANNIYAGTWNISMGGGASDCTLMSLGATAPINETLAATVNFGQRAGDGVNDATEIKGQISAKVAKNMSLYFRAAKVSYDTSANEDFTRTRLYAAYKF